MFTPKMIIMLLCVLSGRVVPVTFAICYSYEAAMLCAGWACWGQAGGYLTSCCSTLQKDILEIKY